MDQLEFLSGVGLFKGLQPHELKKVLPLCRKDEKEAGELIFREGDPAVDVCVVIEGSVELRYDLPGRTSTGEHTFTVVPPTKAFGWSTLVPPHKMTLSAYAGKQGCVFYRVSGKALNNLFEEDSRIGYLCMKNVARVIAKRFHEMEDEAIRSDGADRMHKW